MLVQPKDWKKKRSKLNSTLYREETSKTFNRGHMIHIKKVACTNVSRCCL